MSGVCKACGLEWSDHPGAQMVCEKHMGLVKLAARMRNMQRRCLLEPCGEYESERKRLERSMDAILSEALGVDVESI